MSGARRPTSLAVIVSTYNRPDALRLVLAGLARQSRREFELIVADDGSGEPTRAVVEEAKLSFNGRLQHVWHEDAGFRAGAIRNRAASRATAAGLVFSDGDCIPRSRVVAGHATGAHAGRMVRGSRVLLSEPFTAEVLVGRTSPDLEEWAVLHQLHRRGCLNRLGPLREGLIDRARCALSTTRGRRWQDCRSCNLAVPRAAFERVGGFDESFTGWGYEDSDLTIRLLNLGLRIRRAPAATTLFHLWHAEQPRTFEPHNLKRLNETLASGRTLGLAGLHTHHPKETPPCTS